MRTAVSGSYVFPCPVALLSCRDAEGHENIITLAWVGVACSDPPMVTVAIRPQRHSHGIVGATGRFALNIPTSEQLEQVDYCGTRSGRTVNKFESCGLTPIDGEAIDAPVIAECPYAVECRVLHRLRLGTHDLFVAEIVAAHADDAYLDAQGKVDYAKVAPLTYCPEDYFTIGQRVGHYGMSKKKEGAAD